MTAPFLALITPLSQAPGEPTHPIAPGGPPLGTWGGSGVGNYPDAGFPGPQPGGPVRPTHPIYYPPGIWGPIGNYPDAGFPGPQPGGPIGTWGGSGVGNYPDAGFPGPQPGGPVRPTHPIYYPPVIWPGPGPLPGIDNTLPGQQPEGDRQPKVEWKSAWSPTTGWIVVGVPTGEHVTPSGDTEPK